MPQVMLIDERIYWCSAPTSACERYVGGLNVPKLARRHVGFASHNVLNLLALGSVVHIALRILHADDAHHLELLGDPLFATVAGARALPVAPPARVGEVDQELHPLQHRAVRLLGLLEQARAVGARELQDDVPLGGQAHALADAPGDLADPRLRVHHEVLVALGPRALLHGPQRRQVVRGGRRLQGPRQDHLLRRLVHHGEEPMPLVVDRQAPCVQKPLEVAALLHRQHPGGGSTQCPALDLLQATLRSRVVHGYERGHVDVL
mmetsp:Transcript_56974/g.166834  ORF Transcript_56974/g.166834 Transcript_56974/m.166834 type:complete len:263 (+) Transcript_56974:511-1299(+)